MTTSAWGLSFGDAWGDSFQAGTTPPPPPPPSDVTKWGNPWRVARERQDREEQLVHYVQEQNDTVVSSVLALLAAGELA